MTKPLRPFLTVLAAVVIFAAGFVFGQQTPAVGASFALQGESDAYLARFERIWSLVHEEYFDQPLDDETLIRAAINGLLGALEDNHTSYMPPDEFTMYNEEFSGSYTGIGALVEAEEGKLYVVSPYEGSPAEKAGLLPGDEIVRIDETWVSEFEDPLAAVTLVRGPKGEAVELLMRREGKEFEVSIVRDTIPLISASGEMRDDGLGYVRITDFGQTTMEQLRATLAEIMAEEPSGLILDLRGNPGGSLDTAIRVTSEFIGEGTVMIEEWGDGNRTTYEARPGGLATDPALPLVVLVDAGSASASEIVAGAIQDMERGQVLGDVTYGKGTVQNWHDLGEGNGGVRITIARWLTPNGTWVHEKGIQPDVLVELNEADREADRDIQLESAVALLLGKPLPEPSPLPPVDWACCRGRE